MAKYTWVALRGNGTVKTLYRISDPINPLGPEDTTLMNATGYDKVDIGSYYDAEGDYFMHGPPVRREHELALLSSVDFHARRNTQ